MSADDVKAVADAMREARERLTDDDEFRVAAHVAALISMMIWEAVQRYMEPIANGLSPKNRGDDRAALAASLLGVMRGALAGAARCGRALGMTQIEFAVEARDVFSKVVLTAREVGPPVDEQH